MKILVVEDEADFQLSLKRYLEEYSFSVECVESMEAARRAGKYAAGAVSQT